MVYNLNDTNNNVEILAFVLKELPKDSVIIKIISFSPKFEASSHKAANTFRVMDSVVRY